MDITLLVGAAEFVIAEAEARRLEQAIRRRCMGAEGKPRDGDARACLQLADVLAEDLARRFSPEPIELGRQRVEALCEYVLDDEEIAGVEELASLCGALKRFRETALTRMRPTE